MSSQEDGSGEKAFEPTPQKLESARRKGDVPRSMDLSAATGFVAFYLTLILVGSGILTASFDIFAGFFAHADQLSTAMLSPGGGSLARGIMIEATAAVAPLFLTPLVAVFLIFVAQRAIVVSPDKIIPKLSRLSLISNAKQKLGPTGLVQFAKSLLKLIGISIALYFVLAAELDAILGSVRTNPRHVTLVLNDIILTILLLTCVIYSALAVVDLLWQRYDHARKLRMTFQEVKEETKQSEGDPHLKSKRRQRGYDIATNRMMADVPDADVVIVNPTHYAVALKWSRAKGEAPICLAKGVDEIAARIREISDQNGIPLHRDPPTARAIHASVEVGEEIQPQHFRAVAAALRFAEEMRATMRNRTW